MYSLKFGLKLHIFIWKYDNQYTVLYSYNFECDRTTCIPLDSRI